MFKLEVFVILYNTCDVRSKLEYDTSVWSLYLKVISNLLILFKKYSLEEPVFVVPFLFLTVIVCTSLI